MLTNTDQNMLVPMPVSGTKKNLGSYHEYEWINQLPDKKIYLALFQRTPEPLPQGYDYYIVSFHLEAVDVPWLRRQCTDGPIIVLFDGNSYNCHIPNVHFVPYFYWHRQLDQIIHWFGIKPKNIPVYKFSAVCNRITQSKVWITTKLLETAPDSSLIKLSSWLENKNVHNWQTTGNTTLDQLTEIFREKYQGREITVDDFDNQFHNVQNITANPWQAVIQNAAVYFSNESFHYSFMMNDQQEYVWPGPFITEKTLKCLLGATAFIPVGQFETYKTLEDLGLCFEYDFDTTWDLDSGNISRMQQIVELVDHLNQFDINDLSSMTQATNQYNQDQIVSGKFFSACRAKNQIAIDRVFELLNNK